MKIGDGGIELLIDAIWIWKRVDRSDGGLIERFDEKKISAWL